MTFQHLLTQPSFWTGFHSYRKGTGPALVQVHAVKMEPRVSAVIVMPIEVNQAWRAAA